MAVRNHPHLWLEQMAELLETLNAGVVISEAGREVLFANRGMEELTGIPAAEMVGRPERSFYEGVDLEFVNEQIRLGQIQGRNRFEFHIPHRSGRKIPVIISSRMFGSPEGRTYAVITFADISELKEANAQLEHRQKEIETELQLAVRVQQSLVPQPLRRGQVLVETHYQPARIIGGDFGLVTSHDDGSVDLLVCDVSGHGIGAALAANRIYTEAASLLKREVSLEELLRSLDGFVLEQIQLQGFFFSLVVARVDRDGRGLSFGGAGHPPAIHLSRSGKSRLLESRSGVLGCLEDSVVADPIQSLELHAGDRLLLYTDGLTEVFNEREEMLGVEGLVRTSVGAISAPLPAMKQAILDGVASWQFGPSQDDVSLVLLEVV